MNRATPPIIPGSANFNSATINNIDIRGGYIKGNFSSWKLPVKVATTEDIELTGFPIIDDIQLVNGDRILVKDQNLPIQNGIYTVNATNWIRSSDLLTGTMCASIVVAVAEGTINKNRIYICANDESDSIVGISDLIFNQTGGGGGGAGGLNGQIQYNDNDTLNGAFDMIYSSNYLALGNPELSESNTFSITTNSYNTGSSVLDSNDLYITTGYNELYTGDGGNIYIQPGTGYSIGHNVFISASSGFTTSDPGIVTIQGGFGNLFEEVTGTVNIVGDVNIISNSQVTLDSTNGLNITKSGIKLQNNTTSVADDTEPIIWNGKQGTIQIDQVNIPVSSTKNILLSNTDITSDSIIFMNIVTYTQALNPGTPGIQVLSYDNGSLIFQLANYHTSNAIDGLLKISFLLL